MRLDDFKSMANFWIEIIIFWSIPIVSITVLLTIFGQCQQDEEVAMKAMQSVCNAKLNEVRRFFQSKENRACVNCWQWDEMKENLKDACK